jgi:hypothetical protein
MPQPMLHDPDVFPSDEIIFAHLGKARRLWEQVMERLVQVCPGAESQWRYYRDGKSWLLKVTFRKKTLCWVSLDDGSFRMTFYFTDKASSLIADSDLPTELKEQFATGRRSGKIRGITVRFTRKADVQAACRLMALKAHVT